MPGSKSTPHAPSRTALPFAMRNAARLAALLGAAVALGAATSAHAGLMAQVDFKPGTGHFAFSFDGSSEFTDAACTSCTLTEFSWADPFGHVWASTGVGNGGVNGFSATFDPQGVLKSWSFVLASYSVDCLPGVTKQQCTGSVGTTLNSSIATTLTSYDWPEIIEEDCFTNPQSGSPLCLRRVVQASGGLRAIRIPTPTTFSTTLDGVVPAPGTAALLPLGLLGLAWARARRARRPGGTPAAA